MKVSITRNAGFSFCFNLNSELANRHDQSTCRIDDQLSNNKTDSSKTQPVVRR